MVHLNVIVKLHYGQLRHGGGGGCINLALNKHHYFIYYWYSALGPVWAETRVQSGDWYGSGTLHPGQVLRGSLPLLSPQQA